jgi:two-component system phosphate regulon sensor histidine kinase PhoR
MFVILYFSFDAIKENTITNLSRYLDNLNKTTLVQTKPYLTLKNYTGLDSLIKILGQRSGTRITIILPDGTVVADSRTNPADMENHSDRPEIIEAMKYGQGQAIRYSNTLSEQMLYETIAIKNKDKLIGFSRNSMPITYLNNLYYNIIGNIIIFTSIVFIISLIVLYYFSRKFSNNIRDLVSATNKIAQGDFNSRVHLNTKDELSLLAHNLNDMAGKLKENFEELNEKQKEISSIIKSIRDAIVVIDANEKITFCNKNFKRYFKPDDVKDKYYWELIQNVELQKLVKKIQTSKKSKAAEIQFADKHYIASGSRNVVNNDVIIIFYDITDYKNLEKDKKDFISNVSHELKTPLTAIKGFVETMKEDAEDENKRYLQIVERQTQRLINIVQDLLLLSKLENPETKLQRKDVDANILVDNLFDMFAPKIAEKGLTLIKEIEPNTFIYVDEFMFEQVLINLIENALTHTDSGSITVSVKKKKSHSIITVADTGKGIPPKYQKRIFERFFTVEQSHSRAITGTGLGLSIVKHIVNLHKGNIELESTVGKGTAFTIKL